MFYFRYICLQNRYLAGGFSVGFADMFAKAVRAGFRTVLRTVFGTICFLFVRIVVLTFSQVVSVGPQACPNLYNKLSTLSN